MTHHQVLIIGGGSAGLSVAALLRNQANPPQVAIVEPSSKHYYQPLWTLVGGGVFSREESMRDEADFIPAGVTWIQDYVASLDPDNNSITLRGGDTLTYDYLVVAAGIQIDWQKIPGLRRAWVSPAPACAATTATKPSPPPGRISATSRGQGHLHPAQHPH